MYAEWFTVYFQQSNCLHHHCQILTTRAQNYCWQWEIKQFNLINLNICQEAKNACSFIAVILLFFFFCFTEETNSTPCFYYPDTHTHTDIQIHMCVHTHRIRSVIFIRAECQCGLWRQQCWIFTHTQFWWKETCKHKAANIKQETLEINTGNTSGRI